MSIYKGSQKIGDIYFGTPNTNCLTYIPQDINLTLDPLNVSVTGSPTVSSGVVSGFSASNYVTLPKVFNPSSANNWEVVLKFKLTALNDPSPLIVTTTKYEGLALNVNRSGKIVVYLSSDGTSWNMAKDITGTVVLAINTDYWVKLTFDGSNYIVGYSTNGTSFTTDITVSNTATVYSAPSFTLGKDYNSKYLSGSIDLPNSYIKVGSSTWWKGGTGTLTLKAGSKVYFGDGTSVITTTNLTRAGGSNGDMLIVYLKNSKMLMDMSKSLCVSSDTQPTFTNYGIWFDTVNKVLKYTSNNFTSWQECSFPVAKTTFTNRIPSSIDQVFNGFGYIGGTFYMLPNIEGNASNGMNTDGTYNVVPFKTSTVVMRTDPMGNGTISYALQQNATSLTRYEYFTLKEDGYLYATDGRKIYGVDIGKVVYENNQITSLTVNKVQPEKIARKIARVYKGSTLVYGYGINEVIFEQATAGDYSLDIKVDGYYQMILVGGGGGGAFNSSGNHGSSAAGNSGGYVNVKAYLKKGSYTITVGAGGNASGGQDADTWGGNGSSSIIKLNDNTLVLAGGGTGNRVWWKDGYAYNEVICTPNEINSDNFTLTETIENQIGNAGGLGGNGSSPTGGASTYGGYGKGGNVYNRNSADDGVAGYVKVVAI